MTLQALYSRREEMKRIIQESSGTRLEEEGVGPQIWGSLGPAESGLVKGMTFGVSIKNLPGESFGAN